MQSEFKEKVQNLSVKQQFTLGVNLLFGKNGYKEDFFKAKYCFEEASKQEDPGALLNLGLMFLKGYGGNEDVSEAIKCFERSSAGGESAASYNLGMIFFHGMGCKKDLNKAEYFFELSSERGYAPADHFLGVILYNGEYCDQDFVAAREHLRRAAIGGISDAQRLYGVLLANAAGGERDMNGAFCWLDCANGKIDLPQALTRIFMFDIKRRSENISPMITWRSPSPGN